jgi:ribonuclease P protein component
VLPPRHRLRRSADVRLTVRRGRVGRGRLVQVHVLSRPDEHAPAKVGFAVSRAVGDAVTRNRVRRQLRHLVAERVHRLPEGSTTVVRALPAAASTDSTSLGRDLDVALERALTPSSRAAVRA